MMTPHENDVLFGRGAAIMSHPGNQRLRALVERRKEAFVAAAKRKEKRNIAMDIVREIQNSRPPGRFLTEDPRGGAGGGDGAGTFADKAWACVGPDKALAKVMHGLREKDAGDRKRETRKKARPPPKRETAARDPTGSEFAGAGFPQLPPLLTDESASAVASVTDSAATPLGDYTNHGAPSQHQRELAESFEQVLTVTHASSKREDPGKEAVSRHDPTENFAPVPSEPRMRAESKDLTKDRERAEEMPISRVHRESIGSWQVEESGDLDQELDSFLRAFSSNHDDGIKARESTMREWIDRSKQMMGNSPKDRSEYIRSALSIALKLTECLIEAEQTERTGSCNPIPLASIVAGNVLIRAAVFGMIEESTMPEVPQDIEHVWIVSCIGDHPETGGSLSRLAALGVVLHELFSRGEVPTLEGGVPNSDGHLTSLNSIKLDNELSGSDRPNKKPQRHGFGKENIAQSISMLELMEVPRSLCALLENLLDCSNGDFCSDSAFTSFSDVHTDLNLMLSDPAHFLDDIPTNPLPSLKIGNKLYGREEETENVENCYRRLQEGTCSGIILAGGAGVGKSKLAMHVGELTSRAGGYFVGAKYEQNKQVNTLSEIGSVFNVLCELFARDATPSQLASVDDALGNVLGSQATLLASVLPSLDKLMPTNLGNASPRSCIDVRLSLSFLFTELLRVISSHSTSISLFFDDLHWADPASLLLIGTLISSVKGNSSVFFTCCYRDNEVSENSPFKNWIDSVTGPFITIIKLENMTEVGVNRLVSDTLHLSPRITRPLSSVLHHKTRGNPLFLRQLIESLRDQGHISFRLTQQRWAWDLNKIMDLKISDDVVTLLINEMHRLPAALQMSLKVASCLGSCVRYPVLDIIARDLDLDLQTNLQQMSEKGFLQNEGATSAFRFVHDKIEQSALELMSEQERRGLHMRLGLAIASHIVDDDDTGNDEILFAAMNQINCAGLSALPDPSKRGKIASLNLRAGKRAVAFSDFNAALKLFQNGVSFLPSDSWTTHYDLSIDLFDAAAEAACITNDRCALTLYSNQLLHYARCDDDKLNCLFSITKTLRQASMYQKSMETSFEIIKQCGDELPVPMGNKKLNYEMQVVNNIFRNTTDESIFNMGETKNRRVVVLLKTYATLANMLMFTEPSLSQSVSLRMVDLTLKYGLTSECPLAFAYHGGTLVSLGHDNISEACRLGRIALKLVDKSESSKYKSNVIFVVYYNILWASSPLQAVGEVHLVGHQAGMQSGDFLHSVLNEVFSFQDNYIAGNSLNTVRKQFRDFFLNPQTRNFKVGKRPAILHHEHAAALQDGEHRLNEEHIDDVPSHKFGPSVPVGRPGSAASLLIKNLCVQRALLFRRFNGTSFDNNNLLDLISKEPQQLRPMLLMGIFFEGLLSFQLARRTNDETRKKWTEKGISALAIMQCWTRYCEWNFENKMLLLEAEKMYTLGHFDQAGELFSRSVQSAHSHKFIHEVAIASENAGDFFYERHVLSKSVAFYKYSIRCYKEWGAQAVAQRLERDMQNKFGPGITELGSVEDSLEA